MILSGEGDSEAPGEPRAGDVLLLPLALAAFWTLAYQLAPVARWPAQTMIWCFFVIALAGLFLLARLWKNAMAARERERARVLAALQSIDPRWHSVLEAGGLILMSPAGGAPEGPA